MRIESIATGTLIKPVVKEYDINGNKVNGYQLIIDINDEADNLKCTQDVYDDCKVKNIAMGTVCKFRLEYNTDPSVKKSGSLRITGIQVAGNNAPSASALAGDTASSSVSTPKRKA